MPKKIAFIKLRGTHPFPKRVVRLLVELFPEWEVETVEVMDLLRSRMDVLLPNVFVVLKEYGFDIMRRRKRLSDCFFRTTFMFKKMSALSSNYVVENDYLFSFQDQSMFDASTPGVPHFVYTDHTHLANLSYPGFDKNKLFSKGWIELEKSIYHNATLVFTRSSNITRSIVEDYQCKADKVVCVYYAGAAAATDDPVNKEKYASKNILFIGIDWKRKGGPELVEAFKRVLDALPEATLTIVGCAPRLDVRNCTVVGRVPLDAVSRYYDNAAVFCLPTKLEPAPNVLIEALTHKLPIVATDIGPIPDFVLEGENGRLVSPDDVDELAAALIDFLGNPRKCRSFGARGYEIAMERYTWGKVGAKVKQSIDSVLTQEESSL